MGEKQEKKWENSIHLILVFVTLKALANIVVKYKIWFEGFSNFLILGYIHFISVAEGKTSVNHKNVFPKVVKRGIMNSVTNLEFTGGIYAEYKDL